MRPILFAALVCLTALPLRAEEVVENDLLKVFAGKWVQSKDPAQNGILMYLTQERSSAGEYFSIRCDKGGPSVRLGFPKRRSGKDVAIVVDGTEQRVAWKFTGKTKDPHFSKGNVFGYEMTFADDGAEAEFLDTLRSGRMLTVDGQTLPIELAGSGTAIKEQAGYCN